MAEQLTTLNTTLKQVLNVMMQSTTRIVTAINKVGSILAKVGIIGKGLSTSRLAKQTGISKIGDFNKMIDQMFQGVKSITLGTTGEETGKPAGFLSIFEQMKADFTKGFDLGGAGTQLGKRFKGVQKVMGGVGKTLMKSVGGAFMSLGPQMALFALIMEPLQALIGAFLEPLDALIPIFEAWGSILSQLLVPIIGLLIDILVPLTPAFVAIVNALMPLIELLASSVGWLVPFVQILAQLIILVANVVGVFTNLIGGLGIVFEVVNQVAATISSFFTGLIEGVNLFVQGFGEFFARLWENIINGIRGFGETIQTFFEDLWNGLLEKGRNFLEGGFDGDPETWW